MKTEGSARTVLVFGPAEAPVGVLSAITATAVEDGGIHLLGPGGFAPNARQHVQDIIAPLVGDLLREFGREQCGFEVSVSNLAAASVRDQALLIEGFSADTALVLALVSAGLGFEARADLVSTGHVASQAGDLTLVSSLPAKLRVAMEELPRGVFVHPPVLDSSMRRLRPREAEELDHVRREARQRGLTVREIFHVADLFALAFPPSSRWAAALEAGWIDREPRHHLARALYPDRPFAAVLKDCLLGEDFSGARKMLAAQAAQFLRKETFPADFAAEWRGILLSLPNPVRESLRRIPLLTEEETSRLAALADGSQAQAAAGLLGWRELLTAPTSPSEAHRPDDPIALERLVNEVLEEIDPQRLAQQMLCFDQARASFPLRSVRAQTSEEVWEMVAAFHLHLLEAGGQVRPGTDPKVTRPEALALLERCFAGGHPQALHEALEPRAGGLAQLLDRLTEQLKRERIEHVVRAVFARRVDPLDFALQAAFMRTFIQLKREVLPRAVLERAPESFLGDWQGFVRAYVEHQAKLRDTLLGLGV